MFDTVLIHFEPIIALIVIFSFAAVAKWVGGRRKEREAYYRSETLKKIADIPGNPASSILDFLREEEKIAARRRTEGRKLGGVVTIAVGIGLTIFLKGMEHNEPAYLVGLIPALIGIALLVHVYLLTDKE